jgi:hypothetical protein
VLGGFQSAGTKRCRAGKVASSATATLWRVRRRAHAPRLAVSARLSSSGVQVTFTPASSNTATPTTIDNQGSLDGIACPSTTTGVPVDQNGDAVEGNPIECRMSPSRRRRPRAQAIRSITPLTVILRSRSRSPMRPAPSLERARLVFRIIGPVLRRLGRADRQRSQRARRDLHSRPSRQLTRLET